ncbi:hypothetical protein HWV62_44257 [Athelia sp. TMB]|nr:hypothetical protein HWV62_44257 [Athelia sp. TMB]
MTRGGHPSQARGATSARGGGTRGRGGARGGKTPDTSAKGKIRQEATDGPATSTHPRPHREKANIHPGQIILDNTQKRRTSEQVKSDKAKTDAEAIAAIKKQEKQTQATVRRLVAVEDLMQEQDLEYNQYAARPDLRGSALPPKKKSKLIQEKGTRDALKNKSEDTRDEPNPKPDSAGPASHRDMDNAKEGFPEAWDDSEPTTADSASDGLPLVGELNEAFEDEEDIDFVMAEGEDNDNEEPYEYEENLDEQSDSSNGDPPMVSQARKRHVKPERTALRQAVQSAQSVPATLAGRKRKTTETGNEVVALSDTNAKRGQTKNKMTGVPSNWKKLIAQIDRGRVHIPSTATSRSGSTSSASHLSALSNGSDHEDPQERGAFDEDEGGDAVAAARQAKTRISIQQRGHSTGERGQSQKIKKENLVHIDWIGIAQSDAGVKSGRAKKVNYTNAHLPFPAARRPFYMNIWKKHFKATAMDWAGSQLDPFGTNHLLDEDVVAEAWEAVFPELETILDNKEHKAVIIGVILTVLNTWRSNMGKAGIAAVNKFFEEHDIEPEDRLYDTPEKRKAFVKDQLDPSKFSFVYRNPENETGKGIFQSELILAVFAYHLKNIAGSRMEYERPQGALALATAAIERALSFWKSGNFDDTDNTGDRGKRPSFNIDVDSSDKPGANKDKKTQKRKAFNEFYCGGPARTWASKAALITDDRWDDIMDDALCFVADLAYDEDDSEIDGDRLGADADPRNNVIFDW